MSGLVGRLRSRWLSRGPWAVRDVHLRGEPIFHPHVVPVIIDPPYVARTDGRLRRDDELDRRQRLGVGFHREDARAHDGPGHRSGDVAEVYGNELHERRVATRRLRGRRTILHFDVGPQAALDPKPAMLVEAPVVARRVGIRLFVDHLPTLDRGAEALHHARSLDPSGNVDARFGVAVRFEPINCRHASDRAVVDLEVGPQAFIHVYDAHLADVLVREAPGCR
mmetsp:Transcript_31780/g.95523  ORF Transcript_31780/g.95523 Transcript_31780/m.95523 type:complete len:223 (+) Transcript_31780:182-850(+)